MKRAKALEAEKIRDSCTTSELHDPGQVIYIFWFSAALSVKLGL